MLARAYGRMSSMLPVRWRVPFAIGAVLLAVQAAVLWWFGQPALCECGVVKLWEGDVWSVGNSQQFFDWYTFSHVIHGFIFYLVTVLVFPRMRASQRILIALGLEIAWEIAENTPYVIDLYRQQALAVGYTGDSILNSLLDSSSMLLGFVLAWRLPVWLIVSLALAMEAFVGYMIHDNLTLNILNFIHQFDVVKDWQSNTQR